MYKNLVNNRISTTNLNCLARFLPSGDQPLAQPLVPHQVQKPIDSKFLKREERVHVVCIFLLGKTGDKKGYLVNKWVSTDLKNIDQIGWFPQVGVKKIFETTT